MTPAVKKDLAARIAKAFDLSMAMSTRLVQTVLDGITDTLASDSPITLRRFGTFGIKLQKPRTITLPSGKHLTIPARKVITFTPSPTLKKKLNPPPTRKTRFRRRASISHSSRNPESTRLPASNDRDSGCSDGRMTMRKNEILEEIWAIRDQHAKKFNYDLKAIYLDLKEDERKSNLKFGSPPRKRKTKAG